MGGSYHNMFMLQSSGGTGNHVEGATCKLEQCGQWQVANSTRVSYTKIGAVSQHSEWVENHVDKGRVEWCYGLLSTVAMAIEADAEPVSKVVD